MSCEELRERMPDHLLGEEDPEVKRHLRGCAACRLELEALDSGLAAVGLSMDAGEPPAELRAQVLATLDEEWTEVDHARAQVVPFRQRRTAKWLAMAAACVLVAGSSAWAFRENGRASVNAADAMAYRRFLATLGGKDVREARLIPNGPSGFDGSVVIYDSMEGQSWVLVVGRAPGSVGRAVVTVSTGSRSVQLPLEIQPNGQAYSMMVTSQDLTNFRQVTIGLPDGTVLASGTVPG